MLIPTGGTQIMTRWLSQRNRMLTSTSTRRRTSALLENHVSSTMMTSSRLFCFSSASSSRLCFSSASSSTSPIVNNNNINRYNNPNIINNNTSCNSNNNGNTLNSLLFAGRSSYYPVLAGGSKYGVRFFSAESAVSKPKEIPAASKPKEKPKAPLFARMRSFTLGFLSAAGLGFFFLAIDQQRKMEDIRDSVKQVFAYQKKIEARLSTLENSSR